MAALHDCFLTRTSSFLPGLNVANDQIETYLGSIAEEADVKKQVLRMNGISGRHYAQDSSQQPTHDVYQLGTNAAQSLFQRPTNESKRSGLPHATYLSAGTTFAPLAGPGIATILHDRLGQQGCLSHPVELSSHAGICTSSAAAMVGAIRAVQTGDHRCAVCVGSEHASEVLKSSVFQVEDDRHLHEDVRKSQWFMSVFLRFMLSDGAGAFWLQDQPDDDGCSLRVDWTHSMSFAPETELCMKMESRNARLTQDVSILSKYLVRFGKESLADAMTKQGDSLDRYRVVLPHMSSFFFRRRMERILQEHSQTPDVPVPYWTNLQTLGNTGAASIYLMLDQFLREQQLDDGDRILLFIPESGQFNFVLISLTAIVR
ncbi:3-oxoacyl-[acyl-carrier-protein] synthase III C-terminal domain-containing protein [Neorhodopirellula lusitana]|uniref:3-oxoacyl-[acyl-carrier-protein] synthase III C-terminal domain-containing protein n=1 Tax=Neorhodopirellula lusitana TaxID=445327 RepID=UPI00384B0BAD